MKTTFLFAATIAILLTHGLVFAQDTTLTITNTGLVGIGTTNPGAKLEIVRDGSGAHPLIVRNAGAFPHYIGIFYGQDESKGWWLNTTSDGNFHIGAENLISNDGRIVIQDNTGNVGIGTTNPGAKLEIVRDGTGNHPLIVRNSGSIPHHIGIFYGQDQTKGWWLRTESDGNFHIGAQNTVSNDGSIVVQYNTGNVGIGTLSPNAKLEVAGAGGGILARFDGNVYIQTQGSSEPALRFTKSSTGDNTQWGLGQSNVSGNNNLHLRYKPSGSTWGDDLITINTDGRVGIGTNVPDQLLSVNGNASKVGGGTWATFSDQRLKQDINTFTGGLSVLKAIRPVTFRYNGKLGYPTDKRYVGVIAQEIQSVAPYTVDKYRAKLNPDDIEETDVLRFDGTALTYIAINAIKELDAKVEDIRKLQKENQNLSERLAELEALVKSLAAERTNLHSKSMTALR